MFFPFYSSLHCLFSRLLKRTQKQIWFSIFFWSLLVKLFWSSFISCVLKFYNRSIFVFFYSFTPYSLVSFNMISIFFSALGNVPLICLGLFLTLYFPLSFQNSYEPDVSPPRWILCVAYLLLIFFTCFLSILRALLDFMFWNFYLKLHVGNHIFNTQELFLAL